MVMNKIQSDLHFLKSLSPSMKIIGSLAILGYLLSYSETAVQSLSVIPGNLLPSTTFAIWTAFTFCFLEIHIWNVCFDIIIVYLSLRLIEPLWDQFKIMTFFAVVNFSVAVLSSLYYLLLYAITKNTDILFDIKIHGLIGFLAGLVVASVSIMPNLLITKTPFGSFTNRNIPLTFLIMSIVFWAVGLMSGSYAVMFTSGLISSFIYLRFYQHHGNGMKGNGSENFTFANFFPQQLQPAVHILVNPIYKLSVNIGFVSPLTQPMIPLSQSNEMRMSSLSVSSNDQQDNERRRAIALRALNERWKSLTSDASKTQIPKSFPQSSTQKQHHSHSPHSSSSSQGHGFAAPSNISHGHSHDRVVIPKFNIDEIMKPIPLPPPPSLQPLKPNDESSSPIISNENL